MDKAEIAKMLDMVTNRLINLQRPEGDEEMLKRQKETNQIIGAFPRDFGMTPLGLATGSRLIRYVEAV